MLASALSDELEVPADSPSREFPTKPRGFPCNDASVWLRGLPPLVTLSELLGRDADLLSAMRRCAAVERFAVWGLFFGLNEGLLVADRLPVCFL